MLSADRLMRAPRRDIVYQCFLVGLPGSPAPLCRVFEVGRRRPADDDSDADDDDDDDDSDGGSEVGWGVMCLLPQTCPVGQLPDRFVAYMDGVRFRALRVPYMHPGTKCHGAARPRLSKAHAHTC